MLEFCLVAVFSVHLMCMNVGSAGPLVCVWLEWREGCGDPLAGRAGRFLASVSLALLVLGSLVGLLLGWLLWSPPFRDVLTQLEHRVWWGVAELLFSLLLMAVHVVWWIRVPQSSVAQRVLRMLCLLVASTNLLYHFPFLFVIISNMLVDDPPIEGPVVSARFVWLMLDSGVLARTSHFWMASLAMAGVTLVYYSLHQHQYRAGQLDDDRAAVWGARLALAATLLQFPIGIWLLLELPVPLQQLLMGGSLWETTLFCVSILMVLLLVHQLTAMAVGKVSQGSMRHCIITMIAVVVLMSGTLRSARAPIQGDRADRHQTTEYEHGN